MFGNCVWAQLSSTHFINQNIYNFTHLFHLPKFKSHFTLEYDLKKPFKKENYILDDLIIDGGPYLTNKNGFHAFQQDYFMKNNPSKKLHISMAYKLGKEFTYKEFDFLKSMRMDDFISKKDLEVHFWNCNSKNPEYWKMIS